MTTLLEALSRRVEELACYDKSCAPPPIGTGGSKPGGGKFDMSQVDSDRRLGRLVADRDWIGRADRKSQFDDAARLLANDLKENRRQIRIRIPAHLVNKILIKDQKVKTQHETGGSGGMFDPDARDRVEETMFGAPHLRPVYGYIGGDGLDNGTLWYGEVALVLKPEVQDRATLTLGDSLDFSNPPAPVKISDLKENPSGVRLAATSHDFGESYAVYVNSNNVSRMSYIEAQIFGGVTKDDIAKVVLTDRTSQYAETLRSAGYTVEMTETHEYALEGTEDFACRDASCAPPPVGTGGSRPGPSKGRLSPTDKSRVKPDPAGSSWGEIIRQYGGQRAFEEAIGNMFKAEDLGVDPEGRPIRVEIDRISDYGQDLYVQGSFKVGAGVSIGRFARNVGFEDGALVVDHSQLSIREKYRGLGIAQKFNDHAMKGYEELGVDRILVEAALTHGPFAWARQGYRIDETKTNRHQWVEDQIYDIRQEVKGLLANKMVSESDAQEMNQTLTDLRNASAKGADVQPIHVASIGEGDKRWSWDNGFSWLGKDQLIAPLGEKEHRTFHGVYYLGRESVLASAFERRMEELACRDRSCAPPPVGTGGSKPSGVGGKVRGLGGDHNIKLTWETFSGDITALEERSENALRKYIAAGAKADKMRALHGENSSQYMKANDEVSDLRAGVAAVAVERAKTKVARSEFTTKGGKKVMVFRDDEFEWDDKLVHTAVSRYADLVDNFDAEPIPLAFGPRAAAMGYEVSTNTENGFKVFYPHADNSTRSEGSQAYVASNSISWDAHVMAFEPNLTGKAHKLDNLIHGSGNSGWFNRSLADTTHKSAVEYIVTHEFGHQLYFNALKRSATGSEIDFVVNTGMGELYMMGKENGLARHDSLGHYAYQSYREFAAEAFAVNYVGWDTSTEDLFGNPVVPLRSVLDWAYED